MLNSNQIQQVKDFIPIFNSWDKEHKPTSEDNRLLSLMHQYNSENPRCYPAFHFKDHEGKDITLYCINEASARVRYNKIMKKKNRKFHSSL